jgi:phage terminase large subunit-like protein
MRRQRGKTPAPPRVRYRFDRELAERARSFFPSCLVHTQGELAGQPFELAPWQAKMIGDLFGWLRPNGTRRYRTLFLGVPKKQGKSTLLAGLGLYLLTADGELGAHVISAAGDRDQARIVYDTAAAMVRQSPALSRRLQVFRSSIVYAETGSTYRVISAEAYTKHGLNASGILFDELHTQPDRELYDTLKGAVAARRQPLTIYSTTAGWDRKSICYEEYEYARKIRDGVVEDESYYPVIYEATPEDDWRDPKIWRQTNPSLGVTVSEEYLAKEAAQAAERPAAQQAFRRLHLNVWTESESRWLDPDLWSAQPERPPREELAGRPCFGGLDLAATQDFAAYVLVFPPEDLAHGRWDVLAWHYLPEETLAARVRKDRIPVDLWASEGFITATPGQVIDYEAIRETVLSTAEEFELREIAYDRWGATQLRTQLEADGITMVAQNQSIKGLSPPAKELEKLLLERRLAHGGDPVLAWMAANVVVETDSSGNIKPSKRRSREKIDGIVALCLALDRATRHADPTGGSVYEERGLLIL